MNAGVPSPTFYGKKPPERGCSPKRIPIDEFEPSVGINGPTTTWKIFRKQTDALTFAKDHGEGVMVFAFQRDDGSRSFLVAHPEWFWWYDSKKKSTDRRTYEVIVENEPSKLYLDLEFDRSCNPDKDGVKMTDIFIQVLCSALKREFNVDCDRSSILDLDSTTDTKFSRHLVFQMKGVCFRNNFHVGSFVRMVCQEIRIGCLSGKDLGGGSVESLKELFIRDKKGNLDIFCDEGVYTKNRHFRLLRSTKWNKNTPLIVSQEDNYLRNLDNRKDKLGNKVLHGKQMFLDSLVTHFATLEGIKVLEVSDSQCYSYQGGNKEGESRFRNTPVSLDMSLGSSPIPLLDAFIQDLVHPGRIRQWAYFVDTKILDYDIVGNRFCHNIGRAHKSNNVKYVVDLARGTYYQKCYDNDCSSYRSPETALPNKLIFLISDDSDVQFMEELKIEDLTEVWESVYSLREESEMSSNATGNLVNIEKESVPNFGLSDSDLLNCVDFL